MIRIPISRIVKSQIKPNGISERNRIKAADLGVSFLELVELLPELETRLGAKNDEELSKIGNFQAFIEAKGY